MCAAKSLRKAKSRLPLWGALVPSGHQRLVSAAASVGDGRSPLGCITRAGRREWTRVSEDGEGNPPPARTCTGGSHRRERSSPPQGAN